MLKEETEMTPQEIECGWVQFEEYCEILAKAIHLKPGDAIAVLKANRDGGIFLGRMIEEFKGVEVFELNYLVNADGEDLEIKPVRPPSPGLANRHVFLVTEIVNSGRILCSAVDDLKNHASDVTVVSIYYREGSILPKNINFIHLIKVDRPVRFKWEQG